MASRLATLGSQVSRTASEPWWDDEATDPLHGEHRVQVGAFERERLPDDGDRQRVDRLVATAVARRDDHVDESGRGEPLADVRVEPVGLVGESTGLGLQRQVRRGQLEGRRVGHCMTSGTLWLKVRPSSSAAMRVRWIAGVPPAMAQPCASRWRRSMPNSSL